ncbi:MAG: aspartyl protease family protein [Planctomycetaceae bacterium]
MRFDYSHNLLPPGLLLPAFVRGLGTDDVAKVEAKVDTGADLTVIPDSTRRQLKLKPCGYTYCRGAFDDQPQRVPTYFIELSLDQTTYTKLEVLARPRATLLLGRDLLNDFVLHANGPEEYFELGDP